MISESAVMWPQRNGIAAAALPDRLRVDGRGTVLADDAVGPFIEAHGAANFAGVEHGGDLAVGLLIKPEADLLTVFIHGEAMKVAVRNLRQGNGDHTADEGESSVAGESELALLA